MKTPKTEEELKQQLTALVDEHFPQNECEERGEAMVLITQAYLIARNYGRYSYGIGSDPKKVRHAQMSDHWADVNALNNCNTCGGGSVDCEDFNTKHHYVTR